MGRCVFPDLGSRAGAGSNQLAASTGVAPVSLGSKDQDPRLLDDEAVEIETRGRSGRLTPSGAPRVLIQDRVAAVLRILQKEHTPSPLSPE